MAHLGYLSSTPVGQATTYDSYCGGRFQPEKCARCDVSHDLVEVLQVAHLDNSVCSIKVCLEKELTVESWVLSHSTPVSAQLETTPVVGEVGSLFGNVAFGDLMGAKDVDWTGFLAGCEKAGTAPPVTVPKPKKSCRGWPSYYIEWSEPPLIAVQAVHYDSDEELPQVQPDDVDDDYEDYLDVIMGKQNGTRFEETYSPPLLSEMFCHEMSRSPSACIRVGFSVPLWMLDQVETVEGCIPLAEMSPPLCRHCQNRLVLSFQMLPTLVHLWEKASPKFQFPVESLGLLSVFSCHVCAKMRRVIPWVAFQLER
ncbi:MAG: hypothetical protein KVP17_001204 [Porospora cf. gigantea B]|nr:MAG: hypothetical protein KVP17_001204 [Porospora cf. gigantea B]